MENRIIGVAVLLLFLVAVAAAQVHDIEVAADYSESVYGIRLSYNGTAIMDDFANLTSGRTYEIRYKIRNNGDYSEKANITVFVLNLTQRWDINHRSRTVGAGKSIYLSEDWDTKGMPAGAYWVMVQARVSGDANSSNDNRTRNVTLFGHSTVATTTSTTEPEKPKTTTTRATSTTEPDDEKTSTTRTTTTTRKASTTSTRPDADNDSVIIPRFDPIINIGCRDEIMDHGESGVDCGGPCEPCAEATTEAQTTTLRTTTTRGTTTTSRKSSTTLGATTSSSKSVNAVTGQVTKVPAEGRQAVVTFLVLFAGGVLYLSRK
jgi:hypothetical protein